MRVADGRKMSSPCSDQTQSHFRNQMCQKVGKTPLKKPLPHLETLELFHMLSLCMTELVNWWGEGVGVVLMWNTQWTVTLSDWCLGL